MQLPSLTVLAAELRAMRKLMRADGQDVLSVGVQVHPWGNYTIHCGPPGLLQLPREGYFGIGALCAEHSNDDVMELAADLLVRCAVEAGAAGHAVYPRS